MSGVVSHVLRRGADYIQQSDGKAPQIQIDVPQSALIVFILTIIVYYASLFRVFYTVYGVIGTLAVVEESDTQVLVQIDTNEQEPAGKKDTDALLQSEVLLVKTKPVTSSIRTAKQLLKRKGGRYAAFRGFGLFVVYNLLHDFVALTIASLLPLAVGHVLGRIAAEVVLATLGMTWVHIVISEPSSKPWYRRVPSGKWSKIAPAALLRAVALQVVTGLPAALVCSSGIARKLMHGETEEFTQQEIRQAVAVILGALVSALCLTVLVLVPAEVTFIRVAASMLPEEDETIVPFDRTFADKVIPVTSGGTGALGIYEAWKTFSWEARRRYMGLLVKATAWVTAITAVFVAFLVTGFLSFPQVQETFTNSLKM